MVGAAVSSNSEASSSAEVRRGVPYLTQEKNGAHFVEENLLISAEI
jgi:hypothetical protein